MNDIPEDVKELVIARLETMPAGKKLSIGAHGEFSRDELIDHVEKEDEVGCKVAEIEMEFLRAMKQGVIA